MSILLGFNAANLHESNFCHRIVWGSSKSPLILVLGMIEIFSSSRQVYSQRHRWLLTVQIRVCLDSSPCVQIAMCLCLVANLHVCQPVISPNTDSSFGNFVSHILHSTCRYSWKLLESTCAHSDSCKLHLATRPDHRVQKRLLALVTRQACPKQAPIPKQQQQQQAPIIITEPTAPRWEW